MQHSLQQETLELERRRNVTQAKLRAMQAALAETLSQQARYAEVIAKEEAAAPAQAEKAKTYEGMWKKLQRRLTERGLTPEVCLICSKGGQAAPLCTMRLHSACPGSVQQALCSVCLHAVVGSPRTPGLCPH